ncbi:uncharacterized protein MELLADRAFT_85992 [Melampsora larici-populina 98AG31]|uniref:Secreted protein n=1 Tax=Melampsora larici-populina (strain 98AG31 / pathotype 3-4-7) TaxID=747676 RepID=F4RKE1_MELLP|nr:uncharacterized protein MELLADRAFT_85992 [Melampsora larici-populina 98AG31]EGG07197.1 hypothetical protein MELLADRAFT_85992 [Melampsora larici-populina 98AG31]
MLNSPIVPLAVVALLSSAICKAPDSGYSAANSSDSSHSNTTKTANSTRPAPDMIGDSATYAANDRRRFGANAFIGSAVRSDQQAVFKSLIDDVSVIGSPVQTKVLDSHNFGFPIEGPNYVQIKSGDSRTKTFFDSPSSGFVTSNDGISKETYDSKPGTMLFDRGGFSISFNLDSKKLNGTPVILAWTDQIIGLDHSPYADSFLVYIGTPGNMTQAQLMINETINSDHTIGNSTQGNSTQTLKSSGLNQRAIDMSSFMDKKIVMEFLVADEGDQVVDVACALDDFHWQSMAGMGYHQMNARSGIPGLDSIPGLSGGIPGLSGGIPGLSGGIPSLLGGLPGLSGGSHSGAGSSPFGRRSDDQQYNNQNNYQQSDNNYRSNYGSNSNHQTGQYQGGQQQQQNGAGFIPPFAEQFIPEGVKHILRRSYDEGNQYQDQSQYNNPNSQSDSYNSQQQGGAGFIPPFAEQFIPEGVKHIIRRDQYNQYQDQSQYNNPNSQSDSYNSQQQGGAGFIPPFAAQFIPEGVKHIIRRDQYNQYQDQSQYNNPNSQSDSYNSQQQGGAGFIPPFAAQFIPEGVKHIIRRDQYNQYQDQSQYNNPNSQSDSYNSQQQGGAGFIPPFAEQFIPEGVKHIIRRDQYNQYQDQSQYNNPNSQSDSYSSQQQGGAGFIPPFAAQFIPEGVKHIIRRDQYNQYQDQSQYNNPNSQSDSYSSQQQGGAGFIPPFAAQFIPEGVKHIIRRDQYNQYQDQSQYNNPNSQSDSNGAGFIPPFAQQFIPDGVKHILRRSDGEYVEGHDMDGHQYGGGFSYGSSAGQNGQNGQIARDGQNGQGSQNGQNAQNGQAPRNGQNIQNGQGNQNAQGQNGQGNQNAQGAQGAQGTQNGQQSSQPYSGTSGSNLRQSNSGQAQGSPSNGASSGRQQSPSFNGNQGGNMNDQNQRQSYTDGNSNGNNQHQGYNGHHQQGGDHENNGGSQFIPGFAEQFIPDGVKGIFRRSDDHSQAMDGYQNTGGYSRGGSSGQDGYSSSRQSHGGNNGNAAQSTPSSGSDQMPSETSPNSQNRQNSNSTDASSHPSQSETMNNNKSPDGNTASNQNSGTPSPSNSGPSSLIGNILGGSSGGQPSASNSPSDSSSGQTSNSSTSGTTSPDSNSKAAPNSTAASNSTLASNSTTPSNSTAPSNSTMPSNSTKGNFDSETTGQSPNPDQMTGDTQNQDRPTTNRQGSTHPEGSSGYTHQSQHNEGDVESAPNDKEGYAHPDHTDEKLKRRQFIPAGVQALFN